MTRPCEGCGAPPPRITTGPWAGQRHLHNYCVHCSKDLCDTCLGKGRCRENASGKHEIETEAVEP